MRVRNLAKAGLLAACSISLLLCSPRIALAESINGEELFSAPVEADPNATADDAEVVSDRDGARSVSRPSSITGVEIGRAFHVTAQASVNQNAVYANALDAVIRWRRDAYNDSSVKLEYNGSYVTVRQYLSNAGISVSEYLSPKWSNALERIALQRSIEAYDYNLGHMRPDGTSCFTATYNGISANGEVLAWGESNISEAIDDWASEKSEWIKHTAGQNSGEYGHYQALIDPTFRSYGFAQAPALYPYGSVFAGEASAEVYDDQSPTRIQGDNLTFDATLFFEMLGAQFFHNVKPTGLVVGQTLDYKLESNYCDWRYDLVGTLTSADNSIVSVEGGRRLVPHAAGTTDLYLTDDAGNKRIVYISVCYFSDVASSVDHANDINWMASQGITTGFDNGDGTFAFQPYASVARCDMAAFLYRVAGSPAYEAPASSPFSDVTPDTPHYREICWLAESGVSRGFGDGTFRPYATVVRQDMAAFLRRLSSRAGHDVSSVGGSPFSDVRDGDEANHASDVCWLAANGVSAGFPDGTFGGMRNVARCDMAAFLRRMSDKGLV